MFTISFDDGDIDKAVPRANIRSTASSDNAASCAESPDPSPPSALLRTKASPRKARYMNMNTQEDERALSGNNGALHRAVGDEAAQDDMLKSIGGLVVGDLAMIRRSDGRWRYAQAVAVEPDVAVEFIVDSAGTRKKFPPEWYSDIRLLRTSHGPAVHAELPQPSEATLTDQFEGTKTTDRVESHPGQDTDKMCDIDLARSIETGKGDDVLLKAKWGAWECMIRAEALLEKPFLERVHDAVSGRRSASVPSGIKTATIAEKAHHILQPHYYETFMKLFNKVAAETGKT